MPCLLILLRRHIAAAAADMLALRRFRYLMPDAMTATRCFRYAAPALFSSVCHFIWLMLICYAACLFIVTADATMMPLLVAA